MSGRGRSVLSFVFACALIGAARAQRAGAHHGATQRSSDFDRGWKFALVNRDRTSPTRPAPTPTPPTPATTTAAWRDGRPPARLEHRARPRPPSTAPPAAPASSRAASAGTARPSRCRARSRGKRISRRVRRRLHGLRTSTVNGKQVGQPPLRLHRLRRRPHRPAAHRRHHRRTSLAVKVRNQLPSSRWYSGSGIYRHVRLVVTDPVHVARRGTYVTTPDVDEHRHARASRTCTSRTDVAGADAPTSSVVTERPGRPRADRRRRRATATPQRRHRRRRDLALAAPAAVVDRRPRTSTPCTTELRVRAGARSTRTRTTFGVRWFHFDPDEGFSLNGTHTKLQGVDLHHDLGALGAAVNTDARPAPDDAS